MTVTTGTKIISIGQTVRQVRIVPTGSIKISRFDEGEMNYYFTTLALPY